MARVYAVASAKGGVGKTTTVANLGTALAATGRSVVVVDGDLGMANLGRALGVTPDGPTLHGVLAGTADPTAAAYEGPGGVTVVPGDTDLLAFRDADPSGLSDVLEAFADADVILLDTGAGLSHDTALPLGLADAIVLVSTTEPDALGDTEKTRQLAERLGGTVLGAVLTKVDPDEPNAERVVSTLGTEVIEAIPVDDTVPAAAAEGVPAVAHAPESSAARAYRSLAGSLLEAHEAARESGDRAEAGEPADAGDPTDATTAAAAAEAAGQSSGDGSDGDTAVESAEHDEPDAPGAETDPAGSGRTGGADHDPETGERTATPDDGPTDGDPTDDGATDDEATDDGPTTGAAEGSPAESIEEAEGGGAGRPPAGESHETDDETDVDAGGPAATGAEPPAEIPDAGAPADDDAEAVAAEFVSTDDAGESGGAVAAEDLVADAESDPDDRPASDAGEFVETDDEGGPGAAEGDDGEPTGEEEPTGDGEPTGEEEPTGDGGDPERTADADAAESGEPEPTARETVLAPGGDDDDDDDDDDDSGLLSRLLG